MGHLEIRSEPNLSPDLPGGAVHPIRSADLEAASLTIAAAASVTSHQQMRLTVARRCFRPNARRSHLTSRSNHSGWRRFGVGVGVFTGHGFTEKAFGRTTPRLFPSSSNISIA